ncbi:MAG: putative inorganic carbon transporter subunit DabA [Baekduiaceae bacterium]
MSAGQFLRNLRADYSVSYPGKRTDNRRSCFRIRRCASAGRDGADEVLVRSRDWAQIAPEWGLAGCAAFIVGSRELTAGRDFGSRTFLHSYDASADPDDEALTLILTAPLVVAHWIASQYYFSSVAPEQFGAGTKISHNVVGGIGVLSGPGGDLRGGLPWESVAVGDRLEHEPQRLLAVIDAPCDRIDGVLAGAPQVERLIDGEWITLVARDSADTPWMRRLPGGGWQAEAGA